MFKKVTDAVLSFDLLKNVKSITVALSGGADSMALLDILLVLKNEFGIEKITAAHFNHQIRGDEAVRDQEFVVKQCKLRDVELHLGSANVPKFAKENNISIELAARQLRYEFFETLNTDVIATAHTASDNIETVLFNITRGTGLMGVCGIPPKRDRYIRPLLFCTRNDIENYCKINSVDYVIDSTNLCDEYTRNKIRHNVVPILKELNESVEKTVNRMTSSLREDESFLNDLAEKEYIARFQNNRLLLNGFDTLHKAIAKRVILKYCNENNIETDNFHINQIYDICINSGKTSLPKNISAVSENGFLKFHSKKNADSIKFDLSITVEDNDLFKNCKNVHNLLLKNLLDYDKIVGQLVQKKRESGDTIKLKNKNCTKTLKKLFCEYKIPQECREYWPILADDKGVVWVYKIGVADRCAADENSKKIFKIRVEEKF